MGGESADNMAEKCCCRVDLQDQDAWPVNHQHIYAETRMGTIGFIDVLC